MAHHPPAEERDRTQSWPANRRLTMFFVLAFLISWLLWPLTLLNPESSPLIPIGPAVAAVLVAGFSGGKAALLRLLRQLGRWRVPVHWYALSLGLPCALVVASAALTVAGGAPAPDLGPNPGWFMLIGTFASTLVVVGLFEELGWRGYALPLLQQNHTALAAALLLGVVWGLWHLPELVSDPSGQRPPVPFLLMVIAQSVLLAWIYNGTATVGRQSAAASGRRTAEDSSAVTGSVPLCMIFHAAFNTCGALIFPALAGPHYLTLWWTLALLHVLAALVVIGYAGPSRLVRTLDMRALHGIT
ncbi:CPBP family intramembrane glutamic endopeptidase [Arthrobacter pascens]|uniref:CPBP family intramembrane glutamic endopeptidase n=1 Tax=Arthrobacter pascens TaxID=1677 RepID=UPI00196B9EA4|nr:CPBP family intramembrane glutamic endopeptidase [Arthrobacter pascens]MBN3497661.1 CPBP family intramembrane metalloprotease [Arthrobacter pascens]